MGLRDYVVTALGGTPRRALPAATQDILIADRANFDAAQRSIVTSTGQAFAAGLQDQLRSLGFGRREQGTYSSHSLVYACMSRIATNVATVPFKLWKKNQDGTPGDPVVSHPLLDRLGDPHRELYSDGAQFVEMLVLYLLGSGNGWLMLDDTLESKTGLPLTFTVLGAGHVKPIIDARTWHLLAWTLQWGARPRPLQVDELAQVKFANPDNGPQILGVGPLQAAQQAVNADFARQRYDEAFFVNGGAPSIKMKYEGHGPEERRQPLTAEQLTAARVAFQDSHAGVEKMNRVAALNLGWELEPFGVSQRDMEFIQGRMHTIREVGFVFKVPALLLNDMEHGGISEAGVTAAEKLEARQTTVPICRRLSSFFQRTLVDRFAPGHIGAFDTDEIGCLQTDFDKKVDNYVKLVGAQVPPKAAAELVDLGVDPAVLSDEVLVPFSLAPLSEVIEGGHHAAAAVPAIEGVVDEEDGPKLLPPPKAKAKAKSTEKPRVILLPASAIRRVAAEDRATMRARRWREHIGHTSPLERRLHLALRGNGKQLGGYLGALRDECLDNLRGAERDIEDEIRAILFNSRKAAQKLAALTAPYFEEAIRLGADGVAESLDVDALGIDAPGMAAFLELKTIKVVRINDTIREGLRTALRAGLEAGESTTSLALRVREVFNASAMRARTIARTEIGSSVSGSRFLEMAAHGVERHSWLTAQDEFVRDSHAAIDGEEVVVGEAFGNGLLFPGDPDGPPEEVINCRCVAEPSA